jgi:hypothetical protein
MALRVSAQCVSQRSRYDPARKGIETVEGGSVLAVWRVIEHYDAQADGSNGRYRAE